MTVLTQPHKQLGPLVLAITACSSRDGSTGGRHSSGRTQPTSTDPAAMAAYRTLTGATYPIQIPVRCSSVLRLRFVAEVL